VEIRSRRDQSAQSELPNRNSAIRRRAIFLDVDGTLLEHEVVDPTAPGAIKAAQANGHLVFMCTGRSISGLDATLSVIQFDGKVTSSGASARVGDQVIQQITMPIESTQRLMEFFDRNHILYLLESDDGVFCSSQLKQLFTEFWVRRLKEHADELANLGLPADTSEKERFLHLLPVGQANLHTVSKFSFISTKPDTYEFVAQHLGSDFHLVPGSIPLPGGSSGEVSLPGVTKASGIAAVLAYLGMDADDAVGIGDSWNDIEMFQLCGVSVAMGNAPSALQAFADFTTTPVLFGGVRDAFQALGLI